MVIQIAHEFGPAPFASVVGGNTNCSNDEHDRAGSRTQPGLVHVSLLRHPDHRLRLQSARTLNIACPDDRPRAVCRSLPVLSAPVPLPAGLRPRAG